jgi:hypothetical protein
VSAAGGSVRAIRRTPPGQVSPGGEVAPAATPRPAARADGSSLDGGSCVVLLLADIGPGADRVWGYSRFVIGARMLGGLPGLRFAKVLGSGHEGGFGLRPSASRQGLFGVFDDTRAAMEFLDRGEVAAGYRRHAREFCQIVLHPHASRGSWSGHVIEPWVPGPGPGPVAALTRASIRPTRAASFWRHAPTSQQALAQAQGCRLAVGLGEAPLLRQATFSLWDSTQAMEAYARSGAHLRALRAAWDQAYFSESMFVRFVPVRVEGVWKGRRLG